MDRAVYIAANSAKRVIYNQTLTSNNLANLGTVGFKKDLAMARNYSLSGPTYPSRAFALSLPNEVDHRAGSVESTGRPLDVAIDGEGWFAVQKADGTEGYTRAGNFQIMPTGQLVLPSGQQVLDINGGAITLPPAERVMVGSDGSISIQPAGEPSTTLAVVNQLKVVKPENNLLKKGEDGLLYVEGQAQLQAARDARLQSGSLEGSNINSIHEMVDMIGLSRNFEMHLKMMKTIDDKEKQTARLLQQN